MLYFFSVGTEDFEVVDAEVHFPTGSENNDTACLSITILDDLAYEGNEFFSVHLIPGVNVISFYPYAGVFITDNDGECVIIHVNEGADCQ